MASNRLTRSFVNRPTTVPNREFPPPSIDHRTPPPVLTPCVKETRRTGRCISSLAEIEPERVLDPDSLGDHLDRLFRAAYALCGSRVEAEDLVQETYAQVLARPRRIRGDGELPYLLQALRNTFVSQRRAAMRRPRKTEVELEVLALADTGGGMADPQRTVEGREIYGLIAALPDEFRDAIVAIDVVGMSYREAARALGVREGTVTSRLSRARGRLAEELSQRSETRAGHGR
jgi:RNA polymerase sigma-70 factor, ECF subfamily